MEYLNELELDLEAQFMEYLPNMLQILNLGTSKSGRCWLYIQALDCKEH